MRHLNAIALTLLAAAVCAGEEPAALAKGVVAAGRLNVRVMPGTSHTAVATLTQGETVSVKSVADGWLEIELPKSAEVWIASAFVEEGSVVRKVNLRAGPGVAYESYGVAEPGLKVKALDDAKEHWLKIEPPQRLSAYVSSEFVKIPEEELAKLAPGTAALEKSKDSKEPDAKAPPEAKGNAPPPFLEGDEKNVAVEGILLPLASDYAFATHALAAQANDDYHPLCYLHSSNFNLKLWEGKKVRVKGMQRWIETWTRPLVEVERISPVWQ